MANASENNTMANMHTLKKLTTLLLLLTSGGIPMISHALFGNSNKFDWLATESAPANYPMKIISGNLRYHDNKDGRGLYVPAGSIVSPGWGNGVSTHITGDDLKPLPDQLSITYFSYAENAFYTGKFDLPYDKILKLFKEGSSTRDDPNWYHYITVGVAPGGAVSVWVSSPSKKIEVFHGQSEKVEMDLIKVMNLTTKDREGYVKGVLVSSIEPDVLEDMQKNGIPFGLWGQYRTQYNWTPVFIDTQPSSNRIVYSNGEYEDPSLPYDKEFLALTRPVPSFISFKTIVNMKGEMKPNIFRVRFNSDEVMEAFEKLGANNVPMQLEFEPTYPRPLTQIRLRNSKDVIVLKKWVLE